MSTNNPSGRDIRPPRRQLAAIPDVDDHEHPLTLMQQNNRSVPHLPSERPPQYDDEPVPPMPPFDPTAALDSFSALHINEPPIAPGMYNQPELVPRTGSAMSMRSLPYNQPNMQHVARHANTLPPLTQYPHPSRAAAYGHPDNASVYSNESRNSQGQLNGGYYEGDQASVYSQEDRTSYNSPDGYEHPQQRGYPQQSWNVPAPGEYNPLYAAASGVLGMGPPPGAPPPMAPMPPGDYSVGRASYASSHSSLPQTNYASSVHSSQYYPSNQPMQSESDDMDMRPSLNRLETAASVKPSSVKTKAIDLSAPPYTKQYIDQYRQRIKADPDPEAHFLYAKYLVDAARKIRTSTGKDSRSAKKYSEVLIVEALKVIRKLATQGQTYDEAQFYLANCYGTGALGLQVDHERAYHLYLQAAKQNNAAACYRVAVCNEIGAGTRKEPPRAAAFYRKAASLGDTAAMYKLGMILLHGSLGEPKNPREAVGWLKRAAEQADEENPHALHELALLHEMPNSQLVPYDPIQAKNLFTQAAHLGYTQSQYKLGQCYEYGSLTCPVDPRRSIAWYTKAAEKGDAEAELALSGWYLTGSEGVLKQSDSEAYLWARRAANKGLSKAEYAVGYYAEVGIGIKQDVEFAKRWYMRAAAQGNKRAMNRLTEMKRAGGKRATVARPTRQQAKDECVIF